VVETDGHDSSPHHDQRSDQTSQIGHLHLIDSDGSLHDQETSTHTAFGQGNVDFGQALAAIRPIVDGLPWWCVDFCFNPRTPTAGRDAVPFVRGLMQEVLR